MPLLGKRKYFYETADKASLLSGDQVLGACGRGTYRIFAKQSGATSGATDAYITVNDGNSDVLYQMTIPAGQVNETGAPPHINRREDLYWDVRYVGNGDTIPIEINDGTAAEISVLVEYLG